MRQIVIKRLASIYTDVPTLRPGTVEAYAVAFVCAGIATVVRFAVDPYVFGFFPAVVIATLIGGLRAGLFCLLLSTAAAAFLQMPPLRLLVFVLLAIFIVILITRMRLAIQREQAAKAIQVSKDRVQFTLDMAQLGSCQYDPRRRVLRGDMRFEEIFDVATDEIPIESLKKLVHPEDAEGFCADCEATIDLADPMRSPLHEYRVPRRNGEVRWVEVRWFPYFDGDRRERGTASVVGTVRDVTDRKRAEYALRDSEERLRAIYDGTYQYIGLLSPDGILLEANRASLEFAGDAFGSKREHVVGRLFWETVWFVHTPGAPEKLREAIARAAAGEFIRYEAPLMRPSGEEVIFDFSLHPVRNKQGDVFLIVPEGRIITDRKRAEQTLWESEARLRAALQAGRMAYWTWNVADGQVVASDTMEELFGLMPEENWQSSQQGFALLHPDDRERHRELVEQSGKEDEGWHSIFRIIRRRDGQIAWLEERAEPSRDPITGKQRITGLVWDITEQREAAERQKVLLAELQHRTRNLLAVVRSIADRTLARSSSLDSASMICQGDSFIVHLGVPRHSSYGLTQDIRRSCDVIEQPKRSKFSQLTDVKSKILVMQRARSEVQKPALA